MHLLAAGLVAIVGVNVVPMDSERVLRGQTVIVADARVVTIGPVDAVAVPLDARVIFGEGRWLLPGLIDMHVHVVEEDLPRDVAAGVTTVRDMAGIDSVMALVGRADGPRILPGSKLLTGPNPQTPYFARPVTRASEAAAVVDEQLARGATFMKVYDGLSRDVYDALVAASRRRGVKVAGHVSQYVPIAHAIVSQDSIEHLSGYPLGTMNRELASMTRDAGVWNCPTMAVFTQYVTRDMPEPQRTNFLTARRALVSALHEAGARIVAGTDCGYYFPCGKSLLDELDELHSAGLSNYEALSAATRNAGEYSGDASLGVIAPGASADFLLVRDNPLEDLSTLRAPAGVMLRGKWIPERRRAVRRAASLVPAENPVGAPRAAFPRRSFRAGRPLTGGGSSCGSTTGSCASLAGGVTTPPRPMSICRRFGLRQLAGQSPINSKKASTTRGSNCRPLSSRMYSSASCLDHAGR